MNDSSQSNFNIDNALILPNLSKSIYDFHDDSEREDDCLDLSLDKETKDDGVKQSPISSGSLKMKLPSMLLYLIFICLIFSLILILLHSHLVAATWCVKNKKREDDVDIEELPKNGIESLIKASALTNKFIE